MNTRATNHLPQPESVARRDYYDPETPVAWGKSNSVVSRYADDCWDYSASASGQSKRIRHGVWVTEAALSNPLHLDNKDQAKALLWAYIQGSPSALALGTIYATNVVIGQMAAAALDLNVTLFALFLDRDLLCNYIEGAGRNHVKTISRLLRVLYKNRAHFGLDFDFAEMSRLVSNEKSRKSETQQTPLIPSRVYSDIIGGLLGLLDKHEQDIDELVSLFLASRGCTKSAPSGLTDKQLRLHRKAELTQEFERAVTLGYRSGTVENFLRGRLGNCQVTLIALCVAFTGMRIGEALNLPRDCLTSFEHGGKTHWLINGYTYKLEGGERRKTAWVTNDSGRRAVLLAQKISSAVAAAAENSEGDTEYPLLFCSTESDNRRLSNKWKDHWSRLAEEVCPEVVAADMQELERMQLGRDWALSGIETGARWPMRPHQFRRALAVYAHRSGMVTLPSLKGQLQHITEEMTLYYSAGFQKAASLVFDEEHFSHEWNAAAAESSYFGYVLGLLFNDDDVFGGAATWARSEKVRSSPVSVYSREHALEMFRRGEISYRETALGGCTATEVCVSSPLNPIPYECLKTNCKNLAVFGKRLERVTESQQMLVASLAASCPGSVEHRLEVENLEALKNAKFTLKEAPKNV